MKDFIKKYSSFHRVWWKSITKNKTIELEVYTSSLSFHNLFNINIGSNIISFYFDILNSLFSINFKIDWKCDHAGIEIQLSLLGITFNFNFHDNRHWDYINNKWEEYDD